MLYRSPTTDFGYSSFLVVSKLICKLLCYINMGFIRKAKNSYQSSLFIKEVQQFTNMLELVIFHCWKSCLISNLSASKTWIVPNLFNSELEFFPTCLLPNLNVFKTWILPKLACFRNWMCKTWILPNFFGYKLEFWRAWMCLKLGFFPNCLPLNLDSCQLYPMGNVTNLKPHMTILK